MEKHAKQIFWNALLLTGAGLLVRTVGVWFQVLISNRAGAEAMGLFSLMAGVYGFSLTLATSGIHLGVTRVVVDSIGHDMPEKVCPAMRRAVLYALFFGIFSSALLFLFAEPIGLHWIRDARAVPSLRLLGITLPFISLSSAFGGYFTAVRRAYKNACVQVLEQGIKIGATMLLLAALAPADVKSVCCALVLGGTVAECGSCLVDLFLYLADRRRNYPSDTGDGRAEGRKLLRITVPIALTTYLRSGLLTVEHLLIPEGLRNSGASHKAALIAYGSIHSMAMPVILYPAALIASFSGLLVPELAESAAQNRQKRIRYMISRVWGLSMMFSIGVSGILICFSGEIGEALYPGTDVGFYIRILAPLIPVMYVDTATDAMLKGLGEQLYSMNINIADALISVLLVLILTPRYGIWGYLVTVYFSEFFNTVCSITRLLIISKPSVRLLKWVYKPLLSVVGATVVLHLFLRRFPCRVPSLALSACLHCLAALGLYLLFLFLTGCIEKEDIRWVKTFFRKETDEAKQ